MGKLLSLLEAERRRRGMVQSGQAIDAKSAFALVRDMPYQRASTRSPESIIQEWRGTCSGKHYLLDGIFREEGLESRVMMCTHRFTLETTKKLSDRVAGSCSPSASARRPHLHPTKHRGRLDDRGRDLAGQSSLSGNRSKYGLSSRPRYDSGVQPHRHLRGPKRQRPTGFQRGID